VGDAVVGRRAKGGLSRLRTDRRRHARHDAPGAPDPRPAEETALHAGLEEGDVEVVLEKDGMHFRLPADSEAIEQETLGS